MKKPLFTKDELEIAADLLLLDDGFDDLYLDFTTYHDIKINSGWEVVPGGYKKRRLPNAD